jgi:hypothetical protein
VISFVNQFTAAPGLLYPGVRNVARIAHDVINLAIDAPPFGYAARKLNG